jgi:hypothetical protein
VTGNKESTKHGLILTSKMWEGLLWGLGCKNDNNIIIVEKLK